MPKIEFDKIDDANIYEPIPAGRYLCELAEIKETATKNGDEMWELKFVVLESGLYENRIIFDRMVFSEKAMPRIKLICSRLGIDTTRSMDLLPANLLYKRCYLHVVIEDYTDYEGIQKKRNIVPYAGYEKMEDMKAKKNTELKDDEIPF
jgi:hypothetical protein